MKIFERVQRWLKPPTDPLTEGFEFDFHCMKIGCLACCYEREEFEIALAEYRANRAAELARLGIYR